MFEDYVCSRIEDPEYITIFFVINCQVNKQHTATIVSTFMLIYTSRNLHIFSY